MTHALSLAGPLQSRREALGLNQTQLAAAAGISLQQVINLEAGKNTPNLSTARRVAVALDTTVDVLWPENVSGVPGAKAPISCDPPGSAA